MTPEEKQVAVEDKFIHSLIELLKEHDYAFVKTAETVSIEISIQNPLGPSSRVKINRAHEGDMLIGSIEACRALHARLNPFG